jgi:dipeptidase E
MKIVAIGGGEIGRPGTKVETLKIDAEIIRLSGRENPRLLFIPTASGDSAGYIEVVEKYFGKKLGCAVDTLLLWGADMPQSVIKKKIRAADIIYVGGGNTLSMIRRWKKIGVDVLLKEAAERGTVLSGVSAGAVCWFRYANSDSRKMIDPKADYVRIRGLDFLPLFLCPHFDAEKGRSASLKKMLSGTKQVAVALDNCAALIIDGDDIRTIISKPQAAAYRCYWKGSKYFKEKLDAKGKFALSDIVKI